MARCATDARLRAGLVAPAHAHHGREFVRAFAAPVYHVVAPALTDQDDLSEVAALDLDHEVIDRIREPESGAIVAVGEGGVTVTAA